jgi:hypothetical protein
MQVTVTPDHIFLKYIKANTDLHIALKSLDARWNNKERQWVVPNTWIRRAVLLQFGIDLPTIKEAYHERN